ncbi:uncharacterized protein RJT21DRAFT_38742 [Scheffersomyces amazonensis]|uniref:uncharacterized protein n=1 Tax=Scheffersomyces amazonensis TaxID=1078765 RepID=UPI00315D1724
MAHILQASAVHTLTAGLTAGSYVLDKLYLSDILDLQISAASVIPLTTYPTQYFVRQNRKDKQRHIRVFDGNGNQIYSFERLSSMNPVWTMLTYPQRLEVATLFIGFTSRSIDFHNKVGLTHRDIVTDISLKGAFRSFYLNDGAKHSWTTGSKCLEKVINPNGGIEETRERVAKVKLMRQFKLDFEVLVDEDKVDNEIALATAFTSMITQWGYGEVTGTIGPTFIPQRTLPSPLPSSPQGNTDEDHKIVLVIENGAGAEVEVEAEVSNETD